MLDLLLAQIRKPLAQGTVVSRQQQPVIPQSQVQVSYIESCALQAANEIVQVRGERLGGRNFVEYTGHLSLSRHGWSINRGGTESRLYHRVPFVLILNRIQG